jgi:drug/metabolite transporter (DMT)-like permease
VRGLHYTALAVAVTSISFAAIWIRLAEAPPLTIASNRMLVATLLLLPVTLAFGRRDLLMLARELAGGPCGGQSRKQVSPTSRLPLLLLAGLALAAHFGLWTASLNYTSVASSVVFVCTHPVLVALAEWVWLRQKPRRVAWIGISATLVGGLIIGGNDLQLAGDALFGDGLALGGAFALAGYLLIGRRSRRDLGFLSYSLVVFATCWLALFLAALASGTSPLVFEAGDLPLFLALGLVSTIGGHAVFNWALRHLPASAVAVSFFAEPVGSALLAWLILAEPPPAATLVGSGIILVGIYLAVTASGPS